MNLAAVRDLKLEIAHDVFASLADDLLGRALSPRLGTVLAASPLQRIALGIGKGKVFGEFSLAVRLQARSKRLQAVVARVIERAGDEVDVRFIGRLSPHDATAADDPLRKICRPLVIGCSVGHVATTAGTLGLIARHRKTARPVMLSNSHILAQSGQAKIGDPITQPGPKDGGDSQTHVAALLDSTPLKLTSANQMDAAVAIIDDGVAFTPNVIGGVAFTFAGEDAIVAGTKVTKLGRTTGLRHGEITATELDDIAVDYDIGTAVFDHQIEITGEPGLPFSADGDSGSLVLDDRMQALGLVFCGNPAAAGGRGLSYANHLPRVMTAMDLVSL
jgi:hypothetical protein